MKFLNRIVLQEVQYADQSELVCIVIRVSISALKSSEKWDAVESQHVFTESLAYRILNTICCASEGFLFATSKNSLSRV